ncbi:helix-turn-helix domain-containing protein [Flavobacteriaceae bacterium]|nr:helix-turn-helix domain-containing protein [Flavobacteriaceae bacterium]
MELSKRIKELRKNKGLTQLELSEKSGISHRTIQRIENDEVVPSIYSLKKISLVLDEDFNSLEYNVKRKKLLSINNYVFTLFGVISLTVIMYYFIYEEPIQPPPPVDYWSQVYKELKTSDGGYVKYYDTNCYGSDGTDCDIIILKYLDDNIQWKTTIGGNSWDYVEDIIELEDGYFVLGQTGSYGVGNNDVYLTKLDLIGNELWFKTYGNPLNDYGRVIAKSNDNKNEYIIKGEKQNCPTPNDWAKCYMEKLTIRINGEGDNLFDNF